MYPDLVVYVSAEHSLAKYPYLPIPITVPYLFSSASALTEAGHKRRTARSAKNKIDSDDARRRDCVLVGRRENRDMMEVKKRKKKGREGTKRN